MHDLLQPPPEVARPHLAPGGARRWLVAVVSGAFVSGLALSGFVVTSDARAAVAAVMIVLAGIAAGVDHATGRIPDRLAAAATVPLLLIPVGDGDLALAGSVALGALAFAGPLFVAHLLSPAAMGFGDVKLAIPLGGVVGLFDPRVALLGVCLAAVSAGGYGVAMRRPSVRFGPALVLGGAVACGVAALGGDSWP